MHLKENQVSDKPSTIDVVKGHQFGYDVPIGGPAAKYRFESTQAEKESLRSQLKVGVWTIEFLKVDGTPAIMEATLDEKLLPPADPAASTAARPEQPHLLHVYAVDRQGWRSFVVGNVKKIYQCPKDL